MNCILCARRGRDTRSESHVCVPCAAHLQVQVADILRLAADAAACVEPGGGRGGTGRPVCGSRPPLSVDALDPELTPVPLVPGPPELWPTVLEVCEAWERMVRDMRGLAPYGPASAARSRSAALSWQDAAWGTSATLSGCVRFLGAQVAWMTTEPEFPIDDFADEIRACVRVLRRFDADRDTRTGYVVECPHETEHGTCGRRIRIDGDDAEAYFICPSCRTEWSVDRLMLVWADTSDAAMWLDAEAVTRRYGVDRTTLDRWVRQGRIGKSHGLYDIRPLALAQRTGS